MPVIHFKEKVEGISVILSSVVKLIEIIADPVNLGFVFQDLFLEFSGFGLKTGTGEVQYQTTN